MKKKIVRLNETQLKRIIKESVMRALMKEETDRELEEKATEIYYKLMDECPNGYNDWDFEVDEEGVDGPYTFYGHYYADYEDEDGGTWHFEVGCSGYIDALTTKVDDTSDIEFESPDGRYGVVHEH